MSQRVRSVHITRYQKVEVKVGLLWRCALHWAGIPGGACSKIILQTLSKDLLPMSCAPLHSAAALVHHGSTARARICAAVSAHKLLLLVAATEWHQKHADLNSQVHRNAHVTYEKHLRPSDII